jgi:hypothetical protein
MKGVTIVLKREHTPSQISQRQGDRGKAGGSGDLSEFTTDFIERND